MDYTATLKIVTPGKTFNFTSTATGGSEPKLDITLPPGSVDAEYDIDFKALAAQFVIIEAEAAVTIRTNTIAPGTAEMIDYNLVEIPAGGSRIWQAGDLATRPFTVNVSRFYLTCAEGGYFRCYVLVDPTV